MRQAVRHIAMLAGPAALILIVAGPAILGVFGEAYAEEGETLLLILVGSALFDAGFQLCMAYLRIRGRLREAATATWVTLALTISATWLSAAAAGLEGAGVGWAAGKLAGLCVALALLAPGKGGATGELSADLRPLTRPTAPRVAFPRRAARASS